MQTAACGSGHAVPPQGRDVQGESAGVKELQVAAWPGDCDLVWGGPSPVPLAMPSAVSALASQSHRAWATGKVPCSAVSPFTSTDNRSRIYLPLGPGVTVAACYLQKPKQQGLHS